MTPQEIMLAAFNDELEKIASLPRRLREHVTTDAKGNRYGYTTDISTKGRGRTPEGRLLQDPRIQERLRRHVTGRSTSRDIAKLQNQGTVGARATAVKGAVRGKSLLKMLGTALKSAL